MRRKSKTLAHFLCFRPELNGFQNFHSLAEALVMDDFPLTEESDYILYISIVAKLQDCVVHSPRLLLCYYHVFATTLSVALRRHLSQRARLLYV